MTEGLQGSGAAADARYAAAMAALSKGALREADGLAGQLWQAFPGDPDVLHLVAGLCSRQGDHVAALKAMQHALAARPDDAGMLCTQGIELAAVGQLDAGLAALEQACALQPDLWLAWFNLGILRVRAVQLEAAEAAFKQVIALTPDNWAARTHYATLLEMAGRSGEAVALYREALLSHPNCGEAWWGLATIDGGGLGADDVPRMRAVVDDTQATDRERVAAGFALARVLDAIGRYAEAMEVLAQTHARGRNLQPWDGAAFVRRLDAILEAFAPSAAHADALDPALGQEVMFVVSLPRSGSTLTEQVLASHPQVAGTGELRDLSQVLTEESQRRGQPYPTWVGAATPDDWQRLGRRYLERTARWRRERPRSIDKLTGNWMHIGAIRAMLPGARIIACRRDPLETCLACYRQYLPAGGLGWTHDFADLGAYWHGFDRALRQWNEWFPGAVYTQSYEGLVTDIEANVRALLAFCGLPFDAACLAFDSNPRAVRSPSAAQVRGPLRGDTARASRYGTLLDPLRNALGPGGIHGAS